MKKIENLAEYQQLAKRTCVDLGSNEMNAFHMNSGIITEIGEAIDPIKKFIAYGKKLDLVNVGEELADTLWYVSNRASLFLSKKVLSFTWENTSTFEETIVEFKKRFNKELTSAKTDNEKLLLVCSFSHSLICAINDLQSFTEESAYGLADATVIFVSCELLGLDFYQILTNNIEKLQVRYPEKFTEEAALNRNLDAEREVLEKE